MKTPDQPNTNTRELQPLTGREGIDMLKASSAKVSGISLVDFLKTSEGKEAMKQKKIVLAGPPRSGKSCLRQGLKDAIKQISNGDVYPYVLTACPDGEGAWFQESMNNDPILAAKLKADYKSKFTPEFVERITKSVENLSLPLSFVDIGGMTTPENEQICKHTNGAILLCGETATKNDAPAEWKIFFTKLGIPIIAEVYSDYKGIEDIVDGTGGDGVFRGSIHHLERGEPLLNRETIRALGSFIINLGKEIDDTLNITHTVKQLQGAGIDITNWGKGGTKTVEQLHKEIQDEETILVQGERGELLRKVIVGGGDIYYTSPEGKKYRLIEEKQVFANGSERRRNLGHAVSEKLKHGEDIKEAMIRGISEELGISGDISLEEVKTHEEILSSPSYPGLRSQYILPEFKILLTQEQFKPEGYIETQSDKSTYFIWKEI